MLYTKYQGSMPCYFIQENCFMFSLYKGKKGDKDQESIQSYEQTRGMTYTRHIIEDLKVLERSLISLIMLKYIKVSYGL